jgi:hypothetical protein
MGLCADPDPEPAFYFIADPDLDSGYAFTQAIKILFFSIFFKFRSLFYCKTF